MSDKLTPNVKVAFGEVVNVRNIPSRSVTRIEIDIPCEYHVAATEALFGKPVLVIPHWLKISELPPSAKYGVMPFGQAMQTSSRPQPSPPASSMAHGIFRNTSDRRGQDYVALAGRLCRDDAGFWQELSTRASCPVQSESQASDVLRGLLNISSRSELATNEGAQKRFDEIVAASRGESRISA